ncbi:MAG TPA: CusA/CzcA family heavy metal efflux RND transporter [Polyangiaceae bacterium]|nr:CusA/CzcA family heavy metal efflux RND transporter [Polyangiaceae bacterium]
MIDRLIALSVRSRGLVVVLALVFLVIGLVASTKVAIDAVPDVTNVQVQVITAAPTLGPVDVETSVTFPVERSMAGLPKLEEVRSISRAGISVVTLVFSDEMPIFLARQLVGERLTQAAREIPAGYGTPELGPVSSGLGEVYHFEVKGPQSLMERHRILEWLIAPRLRLVPGVVEVNTFGGEAKTLELTLDPQRMAVARVGVAEVVHAIEENHLAAGGAYMVDGRENVTVRGEGRLVTPEDVGSVVVSAEPGRAPLTLRDVGTARYAPMVRYGAVTRDGRAEEAVVGVVMMLRDANSGRVVGDTKAAIAEIQKTLPEGCVIDAYYDRTELVRRTVRTVSKNLVEACVLVLVVLFVMLANVRAGLVVAVTIPLALLGVFVGMWVFGISGNLISLGAIDFGLVVDGAIILVENAIRRMGERREQLGRTLTDQERQDVVTASSIEVRSATTFGEAIIALVYVPIIALGSTEGRMFRPMALTVLFALASAFVLSITVVPALASWALSRDTKDTHSPVLRLADRLYVPALAWATRWPRLVGVVTVVIFAVSITLGAGMGKEFLPKLDEGTAVLAMVRLPSVSLEQSLDQSRRLEKTLLTFPEVTSVVCRTGRAEIAVDPMGINMTDVYVMLKPREEWTTAHDREGLVEAFDKKISVEVPGAGFGFTQPIEMNTNDLLAGIESDLAIHLYGHDLTLLRQNADRMVRVLRQIPGAKDVRAEQIAGFNVLTVNVDRVAIARAGLSAKAVLDTVSALGGMQVGDIVDKGERFPLQVRFSEAARKDRATIAALPVRAPDGRLVPLGQLAHIEVGPGPSQVSRERLQRRITIQLNVRGRDIGSFVEEAHSRLDRDIKLPAGYFTEWAGEYERFKSATAQLAVVVPITLALILVLLVATFGKFRPALVIFLNVPMSISGGLFALLARGEPFSISAGVGFIALFGVAVLNGLVLVSSVEHLRDEGLAALEAVRLGATGRLRPVLTTALVASLGFLPMALATGAGAEVQRPLATVVIGGLLSSTLLTLLVLPAIYGTLLEREERKRAAGQTA